MPPGAECVIPAIAPDMGIRAASASRSHGFSNGQGASAGITTPAAPGEARRRAAKTHRWWRSRYSTKRRYESARRGAMVGGIRDAGGDARPAAHAAAGGPARGR